MKTYLVVFHANWINNCLIDVGNDPDFSEIPTWGVCRPPTRKSLQVGDNIIFIGYVKNDNYFVKGWFRVGTKLSYIEALTQFPNRENVIISKVADRIQDKEKPLFLTRISSQEGTFYQNLKDMHSIENWKCKRVFHCRQKQFIKCLELNLCQKDGETLAKYKNYIVADKSNYDNLEAYKISFEEIRIALNFEKKIRTPKGQHNTLRFDKYFNDFLKYIHQRKNT